MCLTGEVLREVSEYNTKNWKLCAVSNKIIFIQLGVIYNGNFYAISEHPNYIEGTPEGSSQQLAETSPIPGPSGVGVGVDPMSLRRTVIDDVEDMRL